MKRKTKISFAAFCRDIIGEAISPAWDLAYRAFDGETLENTEFETWRAMSGRDEYEPRAVHEMVAVKGRRSQGTKTACKFLVYKIHTGDFRRFATKGDRLHVPVIAQVRDTAREIMAYLSGFYTDPEALRGEVAEIFKQSIELKNGFVISVQTCSYRAPRGITAPLALLDEVGVWRVEGSDVDREVVRSLTPAMVQFPNRKLILLGSPWVKAGVLFERWERRFESSDDRVVLHCPTPLMNPMIPAEELAREKQSDVQNFRREFLAEWLDDFDAFLPDIDIESALRRGVREMPLMTDHRGYCAAIDASGLSGKDRFTLAIGHRIGQSFSFDALRGWSRQAVGGVCDEIARLLYAYKLRSVVADQFGFSFLRELLSQRKIDVIQVPFTARSKPEIFMDLKLGLSQGQIALLDHPESLRELRMLESTRTSGGHLSISAPRGQHDDFAAAISLLVHCAKRNDRPSLAYLSVNGTGVDFSRNPRGEPAPYRNPQPLSADHQGLWRRRGNL